MTLPKKVLFVSDTHWPYHSEPAWELTKKVCAMWKPDLFFHGGDGWDFYGVSEFSKDPMRRFHLQQEIDCGVAELVSVRKKHPNMAIMILPGNHEERLQRFLWSKAPELSGLRSLQFSEVIQAAKYDFTVLPYKSTHQIGDLMYHHGDLLSGAGAKGKLSKRPGNVIYGHHHFFDLHFLRTHHEQVYGHWGNACLCSLNPEYTHKPNWMNGISLVYYNSDGTFSVDQRIFFRFEDSLCVMIEGHPLSIRLR